MDDAAGELAVLRGRLRVVLEERGHRVLDEAIELSSGERSRHFLDAKEALARGEDLALACRALLALLRERDVAFDAVGGLTLGADQFAHGMSLLGGVRWFVVRKRPKGRGTDRLIEGAQLAPGDRVVLVDDVISTGGSIQRAHAAVAGVGADVVFATTLVDRGGSATAFFRSAGVPYEPLFTYRDFGMRPVGGAVR